MKKIYLVLPIIGFLLTGLSEIQAQTAQPKLNQVELMKQFVGNWKAEWTDTILYWESKAFGTGLDCYYNYTLSKNNKKVLEGRQLWGYDRNFDKYILAALETGRDIWLLAFWFTSNNKYLMIPLTDISNPDKAFFKVEGEIKSPDAFTETWILNGKVFDTYDYKRIK